MTMTVSVARAGCSGSKIEEGCNGDTRRESADSRESGDDDRVFNGVGSDHGVEDGLNRESGQETICLCLDPAHSDPLRARHFSSIHVRYQYGTPVTLHISLITQSTSHLAINLVPSSVRVLSPYHPGYHMHLQFVYSCYHSLCCERNRVKCSNRGRQYTVCRVGYFDINGKAGHLSVFPPAKATLCRSPQQRCHCSKVSNETDRNLTRVLTGK